MKIVKLDSLRPEAGRAVKFEGKNFDVRTSFFVVNSAPGKGVNKHRHPYEETLIILNDPVEVLVADEAQIIESGHVVIVPAKTWHAFTNKSDKNALLVTIHASSEIIQEDY